LLGHSTDVAGIIVPCVNSAPMRLVRSVGAETSQWYPDLVHDNHPVDQPAFARRFPAGSASGRW
jgi:hypothetical protein